jgi:hypothetical protein
MSLHASTGVSIMTASSGVPLQRVRTRTHRRVVSDPASRFNEHLWATYTRNFSTNLPSQGVGQVICVPQFQAFTGLGAKQVSSSKVSEASLSAITTAIGSCYPEKSVPSTIEDSSNEGSNAVPAHDEAALTVTEKTLAAANLEIQSEVGFGNQSSVHLAKKVADGTFRCVKRFDKATLSSTGSKFMIEEYSFMQNIGEHPRIAQAFDMFQDASFFYIEMAFQHGGDFRSLKQNALEAGVTVTEEWWCKVFQQCLEGLAHIHREGFVHCDIKEPNLMLKTSTYQEPEVVIIDFGIVQALEESRTVVYGTPGYIAPEVFCSKTWCPKSDLFSLGVVIVQMLIDKIPNDRTPRVGIFTENTVNLREIRDATQSREAPLDAMPSCHVHLQELAKQLLEKEPALRSNALQALSFLETRGRAVEQVSNGAHHLVDEVVETGHSGHCGD